jgi:uncharacterized protein YdbL (DUF1318 family)
MNRVLIAGAAVMAALSAHAGAQSASTIESAKATGIVGERYDGYLGFAKPAPSTVRQQAGAVNLKRRALYSRFAQSRGVSPQEVGITAGCTLLGRVKVGEPYMLGDGEWRRRAAGQAAPVPDYCGG